MKNVAVFFHPFKKFQQTSAKEWEATHFLIWYRIYHDGRFITTSAGKPRRHLGVTPNAPHFIALAEALADPCFDRFDNPMQTICLIPLHKTVHLRLQSHLLGMPEPKVENEGYGSIVKSALRFVDRKRTVSMCAEKDSSLRKALPKGDVFERESGVSGTHKVDAALAAEIEYCCNRAVDRHREHLLRLSKPDDDDLLFDDLPF